MLPLSPRRPRDSTLGRVFLQDLHEEEDAQKWILSVSLFEALLERLEREEARVRDVSAVLVLVLCESCCKLRIPPFLLSRRQTHLALFGCQQR